MVNKVFLSLVLLLALLFLFAIIYFNLIGAIVNPLKFFVSMVIFFAILIGITYLITRKRSI